MNNEKFSNLKIIFLDIDGVLNNYEYLNWYFEHKNELIGKYSEEIDEVCVQKLLTFLKNPKYNVRPIIQVVEKHILKIKEEGAVWGYDIPYLLTGILNSHPSTAIKFIKDKRTDYNRLMQELMDME